jgi:hypothetical protein
MSFIRVIDISHALYVIYIDDLQFNDYFKQVQLLFTSFLRSTICKNIKFKPFCKQIYYEYLIVFEMLSAMGSALLNLHAASSDNDFEIDVVVMLFMLVRFPNGYFILVYLFNSLKTNCRLLYLKTQALPRCKHFSSQL